MTSGLSNLAKALIIIFIISLATLVAELIYVLWRRRVFRLRTQSLTTFHGTVPSDNNSQTPSDTCSTFASFSSSSSKELLYFFCFNNKEISPIGPKSAQPIESSTGSVPDDETEVIDVFKLQNMYGPSRVLFTIKEEDKEADFESDKSRCSSAEKGTDNHSKRISLKDCLKLKLDGQETQAEVKMDVGDDDDHHINIVSENEMTPFTTPCGSPLYFTPSASPTREADIS